MPTSTAASCAARSGGGARDPAKPALNGPKPTRTKRARRLETSRWRGRPPPAISMSCTRPRHAPTRWWPSATSAAGSFASAPWSSTSTSQTSRSTPPSTGSRSTSHLSASKRGRLSTSSSPNAATSRARAATCARPASLSGRTAARCVAAVSSSFSFSSVWTRRQQSAAAASPRARSAASQALKRRLTRSKTTVIFATCVQINHWFGTSRPNLDIL
mmetsp:Transcript_14349/g.49435  ORF Transcript_14349/g.49435 Transcript_14349/m.49435 type:complete len:216 (+) Transcript_14349:116-763(+)